MPPGRRSKRDYAAEYARRQARARAAGFASYYEQRTRSRPGAARPAPEALARLRGHRATSDLLRDLRPGDVVTVGDFTRDAKGGFRNVEITVIQEATGEERTYNLRRASRAMIARLQTRIERVGAIASPAYPVSRLAAG